MSAAFSCEWKFDSYSSGQIVCLLPAAAAHFSYDQLTAHKTYYIKANRLEVPSGEAMWAQKVAPAGAPGRIGAVQIAVCSRLAFR